MSRLYKPGDGYASSFAISSSTGAASNADSLPTGSLLRSGVLDASTSVVISNTATGLYKAACTIPSGYLPGDTVELLISASVVGVATKAITDRIRLVNFDSTTNGTGGLPTLGSSIGQLTLTSGTVTVGTNNDKTGYTASTVSDKTGYSLATSQAFNTTGSVGSVTGSVGTVVGLTASSIATTVWSDTSPGDFGILGSPGKAILTYLDSAVSSRSSYAGTDTSGTTTLLARLTNLRAGFLDNLSGGSVALASGVIVSTNNDKSGYSLASSQTFNTTGAVGSVVGGVVVSINNDKLGYSVNNVSDKTGYSLASSQSYSTTGSVGSVLSPVSLSGKPGVSLAASDVSGNLPAIVNAYATGKDPETQVWEASLGAHANTGTFGLLSRPLYAANANGGGLASITLDGNASSVDDYYTGQTLVTLTNPGSGQARTITAYNATTKVATLNPAWSVQPSVGTKFAIYPANTNYPLNFRNFLIGSDGSITAGSIIDKTGYSLAFTQTFSTTGSVGAIASGVTVASNLDKSGYSLASTQNFSTSGNVATVTSVVSPVVVGTNQDKSGYQLSSSGLDSIQVEAGINARQALALTMDAAGSGIVSGAASSTITVRNPTGSQTRIVAMVDADGNRLNIALSPPI